MMAAVVLILGLIAAGIYTENGWFYVVAGTAGVFNFFFQLIIAGFMKSVSNELKKSQDGPLTIRGRRRY